MNQNIPRVNCGLILYAFSVDHTNYPQQTHVLYLGFRKWKSASESSDSIRVIYYDSLRCIYRNSMVYIHCIADWWRYENLRVCIVTFNRPEGNLLVDYHLTLLQRFRSRTCYNHDLITGIFFFRTVRSINKIKIDMQSFWFKEIMMY